MAGWAHQIISGDHGGIGCLVCGLHLDDEDTVLGQTSGAVDTQGQARLYTITAQDLIAQVTCHLLDGHGHGHHFTPEAGTITCAWCRLSIDKDTPGEISPICPRDEDTP